MPEWRDMEGELDRDREVNPSVVGTLIVKMQSVDRSLTWKHWEASTF